MSDVQVRRAGINEGLFREVNERLEELSRETGQSVWRSLDLVCECADSQCVERIAIGTDEYETLRADSTTFVLVPGHELPDVEQVVRRGDGYVVVRKYEGLPADVARETDPRR